MNPLVERNARDRRSTRASPRRRAASAVSRERLAAVPPTVRKRTKCTGALVQCHCW
jgi:hypothetical protein